MRIMRVDHKRSKKTPPGMQWENKYRIFKFPYNMAQALEIARRLERTGWGQVTITTVTAPDFFHESMIILEGRKE